MMNESRNSGRAMGVCRRRRPTIGGLLMEKRARIRSVKWEGLGAAVEVTVRSDAGCSSHRMARQIMTTAKMSAVWKLAGEAGLETVEKYVVA